MWLRLKMHKIEEGASPEYDTGQKVAHVIIFTLRMKGMHFVGGIKTHSACSKADAGKIRPNYVCLILK